MSLWPEEETDFTRKDQVSTQVLDQACVRSAGGSEVAKRSRKGLQGSTMSIRRYRNADIFLQSSQAFEGTMSVAQMLLPRIPCASCTKRKTMA